MDKKAEIKKWKEKEEVDEDLLFLAKLKIVIKDSREVNPDEDPRRLFETISDMVDEFDIENSKYRSSRISSSKNKLMLDLSNMIDNFLIFQGYKNLEFRETEDIEVIQIINKVESYIDNLDLGNRLLIMARLELETTD